MKEEESWKGYAIKDKKDGAKEEGNEEGRREYIYVYYT